METRKSKKRIKQNKKKPNSSKPLAASSTKGLFGGKRFLKPALLLLLSIIQIYITLSLLPAR